MSEPIPEIQSAYINVKQSISNAQWAIIEWEEKNVDWPRVIESIQWAIDDLESAKAKVHRELKK